MSYSFGSSSLASHVIEVASDALEGLVKGNVDKQSAEQLAMHLEATSEDIRRRDNVEKAFKQRFVEEKESGGNPCFDQANRVVLIEDVDGELRWLCLWKKVAE